MPVLSYLHDLYPTEACGIYMNAPGAKAAGARSTI